MLRSCVFIAVMLAVVHANAAESFGKRMQKANTTLQNGDADGALSQYRELQVEQPESDLLYYNIGTALYNQALQNVDLKATEDAIESLNNAKASFGKVLNASDPDIRMNAAYNHANSEALIAQQSAGVGKYEETIEAFKESITQYEQFLKQYPKHQQAKTNLDHMRYLLKSMLQNPPPPEEQQDQQDQEQQDQNEQQQQDQQDQQQDDQQQQESQAEEQKDEQKQQDEQQQEEQQKQQEQQQAQAQQPEEQPEQEQMQEAEAQPDDKQNEEALLQSLEDADTREQREVKNDRSDIRMKGSNWW